MPQDVTASHLIIAIDGPSGSGKSTLGRMLADALDLLYVDTGSMYRAVALAVIESGIDPANLDDVTRLAERADIDLRGKPDALKVFLGGRDVTELTRTESVTSMSSIISAIPGVRHAMVARQREIGKRGAVLNGRDIGTVVFPNADFKFFLTADPRERASRRFKEDQELKRDGSFETTLAEMIERDRRDTTRVDSPLTAAPDAILIDSSDLSIDEVFRTMMSAMEAKT